MLLRRNLINLSKMSDRAGTNCRANFCAKPSLETKLALESIFMRAVSSVLPQKLIKMSIKTEVDRVEIMRKQFAINRNVYLVGFGKAVLGMAAEMERLLHRHLQGGVICLPKRTTDQFRDRPEFLLRDDTVIKVYEGADNNLPDQDAVKGAEAVLEQIKSLQPTDFLIVLISGGGSALLPVPKSGITLEDKLATIRTLASCGATINELNTVRKKLSEVKGGGLAVLTHPVKTITLILSDVVNDPLDVIASGPTIPNADEPTAAYDILKKYKLIQLTPNKVLDACQQVKECFPSARHKFAHVENFLIGNNMIALQEAKNCAESLGFRTVILSCKIDSPIHTICDFYLNLSFEICKLLYSNDVELFVANVGSMLKQCHYDFPKTLAEDILGCLRMEEYSKGICIIAGGETTVEVKGSGTGGRNQELALLFSQKLYNHKEMYGMYYKNYDVSFLSAGTDGIDGNSTAAGAVGCSGIVSRAIYNYIEPTKYLMNNDSYNFFKLAENGSHLINTGHTGTNVMDLHLLLIRKVSVFGEC